MTTLEKLNYIRESKRLHNILFRNSGVALMIYNPPEEEEDMVMPKDWRKYLTVHKYHDTFEEAVSYEYDKITN